VTVERVPRAWLRARWALAIAFVFALAFFLRFALVAVSRGGIAGAYSYDPSVYYAAADALIHGRLPYRDFVLLHPPGLMLALTPFAALGEITSDHAGFVVGNLAFELLGGANAVLVMLTARRMGLARGAAFAGGLFYAVWYGAVVAEVAARLEPLGSFAFLCGVLALEGQRSAPRRRWLASAGFAFAAAASVKIWWSVPAAIAVVWQLRHDSSRRCAVPMIAGLLAAFALIDLPFFALAPREMWHMVVADQLGRHPYGFHTVTRLDQLTSLSAAYPRLGRITNLTALAAIVTVGTAFGAAAWRCRPIRLLVVIAAVQVVVLLVAPSYFNFYDGYLAPALSLVVAGAAAFRPGRAWSARSIGPAVTSLSVLAAATATALALLARPVQITQPFPGSTLASRFGEVRCTMSDTPMALIELDVLSRDLTDQCPNWVDVTGRTYGVDAAPRSHFEDRWHNRRWQRDLRRYLLSGNAVILLRYATGVDAATRRMIDRLPVFARSGQDVVYAVRQVDPDPDADRSRRLARR
jgi:alpha-1,2-mannosyltransferase